LEDSVKDCDSPATAAQDSIGIAYDGTPCHRVSLEQLAMVIQDDYQSASISAGLRRLRILARFQLLSETPSLLAYNSQLSNGLVPLYSHCRKRLELSNEPLCNDR
ncbi:hypothetical protein CORC01_04272, partial [Colletotrichum orchidophilum]